MAAPKSRAPLYLGTAAAAGVGYYLYKAGGSPKAAEKELEHDLSRASSKMKQELPGRTNQAEKASEKWATEAGAKVDALTDQAKTKLSKTGAEIDQYRKDASKDINRKIDAADRKVEEGAEKAKGGITSWFGGGK